jgi:hypothetical protein
MDAVIPNGSRDVLRRFGYTMKLQQRILPIRNEIEHKQCERSIKARIGETQLLCIALLKAGSIGERRTFQVSHIGGGARVCWCGFPWLLGVSSQESTWGAASTLAVERTLPKPLASNRRERPARVNVRNVGDTSRHGRRTLLSTKAAL